MKPAKLTFLKAGKAVGAHPGFAATFNWLVRFCNNLAGDGITAQVDRQNGGDNPVVRCIGQLGGGGGGSGVSDTVTVLTRMEFTSGSNPVINFYGKQLTYVNGSLSAVGSETLLHTIETVAHSGI